MSHASQPPAEYGELLVALQDRIRTAQVRAALHVNRELVLLYWHIGREIVASQKARGWGARVIDHLARDLCESFPDVRGFSARNLKYMRALAHAWPDEAIVQQVVAQLPWGHHLRLLDRVKDPVDRAWYLREAIHQGWSQNVLVLQIESSLHARQGRSVTNFDQTLPTETSDLARELLKSPYTFDFLTLGSLAREQELERALLEHLRSFLLELGRGFALVGSQYPLAVGSREFRLDLLFYHLHLRSFLVVELKMGEFEPEFAGKMSFYLAAVDDQLRHPADGPTIGLILCRDHERTVVEYALREQRRPIGVSEHCVTRDLPSHLRASLPTPGDLAVIADDFVANHAVGQEQSSTGPYAKSVL
ncbi:MAG: DUF1016 domain-containing protein [Planctomycetes bacterium]|nr:DUF1016 domain-containing protein [Planctomycetota bacterium]